jgi:hypothetical protein
MSQGDQTQQLLKAATLLAHSRYGRAPKPIGGGIPFEKLSEQRRKQLMLEAVADLKDLTDCGFAILHIDELLRRSVLEAAKARHDVISAMAAFLTGIARSAEPAG